jgi:4-hydroxybenzoate polyprenyltransferase
MKIKNFVIHLRLHYQFFILSGGYLLGGLYSDQISWGAYILQFLNVHVLLFGGATAFNSYWDRDEGAIGGLKNPPPLQHWMRSAALGLMALGTGLAFFGGPAFLFVYFMSAVLFWLYSTPKARWKGHAWLSLIAIGVSTGTNSFWLGYLAADPVSSATSAAWIASLAVACVLLSIYPISQLYQIDEDLKRGDRTFAARFGRTGVRLFFVSMFTFGVLGLLCSWVLRVPSGWKSGGVLAGIAAAVGFWIWRTLSQLVGDKAEYSHVMSIKYRTSLSFVAFLMVCHALLLATPM